MARAAPYGKLHPASANVWLQLEYAGSDSQPARDVDREFAEQLLDEAKRNADAPASFWDRSQLGDAHLTMALLSAPDERDAHIEEAAKQYMAALENRSTIRERDSVLTHLDDLIKIFGALSSDDAPGVSVIRDLKHRLPAG